MGGLYLPAPQKGELPFCLCSFLADCLQCALFQKKTVSLSSPFVERFSGLGRDFVFNYIILGTRRRYLIIPEFSG